MADAPYLFNPKIKIMKAIQELHKADAIWNEGRRAHMDYRRLFEYLKRFSNSGSDVGMSVKFFSPFDTGAEAYDFDLETIDKAITPLLESKRQKVIECIEKLAELGYQYDPFNEENQ
jgi:hypothetical protein